MVVKNASLIERIESAQYTLESYRGCIIHLTRPAVAHHGVGRHIFSAIMGRYGGAQRRGRPRLMISSATKPKRGHLRISSLEDCARTRDCALQISPWKNRRRNLVCLFRVVVVKTGSRFGATFALRKRPQREEIPLNGVVQTRFLHFERHRPNCITVKNAFPHEMMHPPRPDPQK